MTKTFRATVTIDILAKDEDEAAEVLCSALHYDDTDKPQAPCIVNWAHEMPDPLDSTVYHNTTLKLVEDEDDGDAFYLVECINVEREENSTFTIQDYSPRKNISKEPCSEGWCGTTNGISVTAHGEFPTYADALAALHEMAYSGELDTFRRAGAVEFLETAAY